MSRETRNKAIFTIILLVVYRLGYYIPLPAIEPASLGLLCAMGMAGVAATVIFYPLAWGAEEA